MPAAPFDKPDSLRRPWTGWTAPTARRRAVEHAGATWARALADRQELPMPKVQRNGPPVRTQRRMLGLARPRTMTFDRSAAAL